MLSVVALKGLNDPLVKGLQNGCHNGWLSMDHNVNGCRQLKCQLNISQLGTTLMSRTVIQGEAHLEIPADQVFVPFLKPVAEGVAIHPRSPIKRY